MSIGQNKAAFTIDYDTRTETRSFLRPFKSAIKKIFEKFIKEGISAKTGKRVGTIPHLVLRTDVDHGGPHFSNRPDDRGFPGQAGFSGEGVDEQQQQYQFNYVNHRHLELTAF